MLKKRPKQKKCSSFSVMQFAFSDLHFEGFECGAHVKSIHLRRNAHSMYCMKEETDQSESSEEGALRA